MRSLLIRVVFLLCLCNTVFPAFAQQPPGLASPIVSANEKSAHLVLQEKSSVFSISLSADASAARPAKLTAKIFSANGIVLAENSVPVELNPLARRFEVPLKWIPGAGVDAVSGVRLSYAVQFDGEPAPALSGILSPYKLIPDLFVLHFTGLDSIGVGRTYLARVRAVHPDTHAPISGVALSGFLGDDDDAAIPKSAKPTARTNAQGEAILKFQLPAVSGAPDDSETDLEIRGSRGSFKNSLNTTIRFWRRATIIISTDKPLYQPEQTLHIRALLIDDERHAWAKQSMRFEIRDPEDTIAFSSEATTSRFGIASADWTIPSSQKLGFYRISVGTSTDAATRDLDISQTVRISRYELPTFSVNAQADHPFYLPGQNAELTVSADYLFGKPILRGHVRVRREASRSWNYHEQKWEVEDTSVGEGDLDNKNQFHVTLDLKKDHDDFDGQDWQRFKDLRFVAYLTDVSSGRTEERHFDIRISHEAIHIYVLNSSGPIVAGLSAVLYISSSFADGTPAPADVNVQLFSRDPSDSASELNRPLASADVRSNRYGIARVVLPALPKSDSQDEKRFYVAFKAKSSDGREGKHLESYSVEKDPAFRIVPAKVILNPGDPVVARIESPDFRSRIRVDLIRVETQTILASQELMLARNFTQVTFPAGEQFVGKLSLVAYVPDAQVTGSYGSMSQAAAAVVVFPEPSTLKLNVTPVKKSYRPGESAAVHLQVLNPQQEKIEGAFGFLVYDQALEELARTEASLTSGSYERINPTLGFQNPLDEDYASIGGIREKDLLNRVPGSSVSPEVELAAEAMFAGQAWVPLHLESSDSEPDFSRIFGAEINRTLTSVSPPLQQLFEKTGHFPVDETAYASVLKAAGLDPARITDPWGRPYRVQRFVRGPYEVLEFRSDGPDKTPNTEDDFVAFNQQRRFFEPDEAHLRSAIDAYQTKTGSFIRDEAALKLACEQARTPLSSFVDPWGTPYRFEFAVDRDRFTIEVTSAGPDKKFRSKNSRDPEPNDDLSVATIRSPYFLELSKAIDRALFENAKATAQFPGNETEFRQALQRQGIDWDSLRDPWGHPYRMEPSMQFDYSDKITIQAFGQQTSASTSPVTRALKTITLWSAGPDGIPKNDDDFTLARFVSPYREETGGPAATETKPPKTPVFYSGSSGAIRVLVKDMTGAAIAKAKVTATNATTGADYTGISNDQGVCLIVNLPGGTYRVLIESTGFKPYVLTSVPVFSSNASNIEVTLSVGAATETIEVTAETVRMETSVQSLAIVSRAVVNLVTKSGAARGQIEIPMATPRLREYFPETLLWRPEVIADSAGHATVKFPLADSITTWKVSVIASTIDGRIATASADLRAFQPFFAELDPPKVLTVGDEIHLPVTVRNYLDKPQSVSLDWSAEPWSQLLSPATAQVSVPPGDYSQNSFSFRAALPAKNARQRVTAYNRSTKNESDAVERKLRVHPDGQERILQSSSIFSSSTELTLDIPANALPGSAETELVIYPNIFAHVSDAIEGIMERPYGCAEQTISSAYPSLLWLQLQKSQNLPASPLDARAKHYLRLAYAKLIGYRDANGGFSYWGKGDAYVPLTAYALRFLSEASEFVEVDPAMIGGTRHWLLQQASADGAWTHKAFDGKISDWETNYYTSYVVRILARDLLRPDSIDKNDLEDERKLVTAGIAYLSKSASADLDPYRVALLTLAKLSTKQDASSEIAWLLANKHSESEVVYWNLERNTLFYGWGLAGRLETTALVLDALATAKQQGNADPSLESALNLGTYFLFKNKDRYNVWYSTQATVAVLQSLVRQLALDSPAPGKPDSSAILLVDGKPGPALPVSTDPRQLTPHHIDLSSYFGPGPHRVEIRSGSFRRASAYLNASYYLPWTDSAVTQSFIPSGDSESIRFGVQFDRTSVSVGGELHCTVRAERIGFRGYGMMLAEVGLPPGADVDRASLEAAVAGNWSVQSYELQPDRVVLYLWPKAGGTSFSFTFKPRFAMNAQSAESILYDYYNPLARASVPPSRFIVK